MPGHMKQTKETMSSCVGGEAYQGNLKPPRERRLYFHEFGRVRVSVGSETECSGVWTSCERRLLSSMVAMMED
jgi:hypothetical protein